jgi:hypothetical protein
MGKEIKSRRGRGKESKFIKEYTTLKQHNIVNIHNTYHTQHIPSDKTS